MDILIENNFGLFVLIVAPGFLSLKVWGLIKPSRHLSFSDSLYEAIFYGVFNYFIVVQWFPQFISSICKPLEPVAYIISIVIIPFLLPIIWNKVLSIKFVKNKTINPIPKAWDTFFMKRKRCFMPVHLKNEMIVGGLYGYNSSASSYPEEEDIYLEQIWEIDEKGAFVQPVEGTMGLLVHHDSIDYIELFTAKGE
ncbi:hypothetical protein AGMMS4952_19580 [Spirochaetia bacterium]|nr:hypothetical protein AGMMS4952_19580 [Spirochaetia bacterium]